MVCVADISVDGGTAMPMIGLLGLDGELVIPTDWDDPLVTDAVGHVVRIELRPPWIRIGPGRVQSVLEGCHAWRLGYGAVDAAVETPGPRDEPVRVVVSTTVPASVRANSVAAEADHADPTPWCAAAAWVGAGVLLAGFVVGWLLIRGGRGAQCGSA